MLEHTSCCHCDAILEKKPPETHFNDVSAVFQLISDPTRLKIVWLLCHCEMCVNHIGNALGMSSPAVSHHLRLLKQSGLIESRRDKKEVYYKLAQTEQARLLHKSIDDIFDIQCTSL